ncbi:MAG: hypothetical protein LQ348_001377, partial [Seirophora lacunosa]
MLDMKRAGGAMEPMTSRKELSLLIHPLVTVKEIRHSVQSSSKTPPGLKEVDLFPHDNPPAELATPPISPATLGEPTRPDGNALASAEGKTMSRCPVTREFQQARAHHSVLASTGCSKDFCQAGRAVHTDEPRIGENRAIETVEKEAEGFLRELLREGFFETDEVFTNRLTDVLAEIRGGARGGTIRQSRRHGTVAGNWLQTSAELEFGIRRSWRNARKCIMRSHCEELKLCDLRNVTSSAEMANELVQRMGEAFNGGNVLPTVFVFPPRKIDSRGPMIWNHQLLEFAGYEMEDGSVLGDPISTALTKAIIELGWEPPSPRGKWDLLPLVVMADNDVPAMVEIPPPLCKLVHIRHPRYNDQFAKLDLNWVAFPALTRLGFDIGGVQYTAAPFAGWFMDAEIGVRDLADTFRYNALPDVANALGLLEGEIGSGTESLEDLPEYERLSILSRAQTELTYAVYWSYQQAKVSMSDSLTASMKWCRYDDDFKAKNGFRLPADPYWLAPPQGSIVPVWHKGGAPCYQPKPMISKHVQDPVKAWERERPDWSIATKSLQIVSNIPSPRPPFKARSSSMEGVSFAWDKQHKREVIDTLGQLRARPPSNVLNEHASNPRVPGCPCPMSVSVYFCSAGTFAEKIAAKLLIRLRDLAKSISNVSVCTSISPLDQLKASALTADHLVLVIVSSTGQGEVPINGAQFIKASNKEPGDGTGIPDTSFRYAIYGNGDSRYSATYNGAAVTVERGFRRFGGLAIAGGLFHGDSAIYSTALQAVSPWWEKLQPTIQDLATDSPKLKRAHSDEVHGTAESTGFRAEAKSRLQVRSQQLLGDFQSARVVHISPPLREDYQGSYRVTLDIQDKTYEDLACVQVLPLNSPAKVRRALRALGVNGSERVSLDMLDTSNPSYSSLLTSYIDLEAPFQTLDWFNDLAPTSTAALDQVKLKTLSSLDALEYLNTSDSLPGAVALLNTIILALPALHPRTYSIASSLFYPSTSRTATPCTNNHLDVLVKALPSGRFSRTFLSSSLPSPLRYKLLPSSATSLLTIAPTTPVIVIATGAGFAPVRSLLQRRLANPHNHDNAIALFLGLKPFD